MPDVHPLRQYRERHDPPLTQDDLARLIGVSGAAVCRWEAGVRKVDVTMLAKVVRKTGVSAAKLRPDLAELFS